MNRNMILVFVFAIMMLFIGCNHEDMEESSQTQLETFGNYNEIEEIMITDNRIAVALPEEQGLPYRWQFEISNDTITFIEEQTVNNDGLSLQVGADDSYHVFVFDCNEKSSGKVYFELAKIEGYGDEEVIDERSFKIAYNGSEYTCVDTTEK